MVDTDTLVNVGGVEVGVEDSLMRIDGWRGRPSTLHCGFRVRYVRPCSIAPLPAVAVHR